MYAGCADRATDDTKRDIFENFRSYGLPHPELIRMDNHCFDRHMRFSFSAVTAGIGGGGRTDEGFFDVIITDPPYGIRAGARKSGAMYYYSTIVLYIYVCVHVYVLMLEIKSTR